MTRQSTILILCSLCFDNTTQWSSLQFYLILVLGMNVHTWQNISFLLHAGSHDNAKTIYINLQVNNSNLSALSVKQSQTSVGHDAWTMCEVMCVWREEMSITKMHSHLLLTKFPFDS